MFWVKEKRDKDKSAFLCLGPLIGFIAKAFLVNLSCCEMSDPSGPRQQLVTRGTARPPRTASLTKNILSPAANESPSLGNLTNDRPVLLQIGSRCLK